MKKSQIPDLPHHPGVYIFRNDGKLAIYVGKARDLQKRVASYFRSDLDLGPRTSWLVKEAASLEFIETDTELEALLLEADLIKRLKPRFNIRLKDDKFYKYIKVTVKEDFPRVLTTRQIEKDGSKYFGPFPEGHTVNLVLKELRRMFPYCNELKKTGKACFYYHIGLCPGPCASVVSKSEYRKQINRLVLFLSGKKQAVMKQLNNEMIALAKEGRYEEAAKIRDNITRIQYITQNFHLATDFLENPNLREDLRREEIKELCEVLKLERKAMCHPELRPQGDHPLGDDSGSPVPVIARSNATKQSHRHHGPVDLSLRDEDAGEIPSSAFRIESYDMSNTSGKLAVGSMVVFINGEPRKTDYRRFRIKSEASKGDTDFMAEVLRRRFKRVENPDRTGLSTSGVAMVVKSTKADLDTSFSNIPDIILVDGGVPQVMTSLRVLKELGLDIPLIGLAKRWEIIVLPSGEQIKLPRNSKALHLLQRMRDEAHRFTKNYHLKLRQKELTSSSLRGMK